MPWGNCLQIDREEQSRCPGGRPLSPHRLSPSPAQPGHPGRTVGGQEQGVGLGCTSGSPRGRAAPPGGLCTHPRAHGSIEGLRAPTRCLWQAASPGSAWEPRRGGVAGLHRRGTKGVLQGVLWGAFPERRATAPEPGERVCRAPCSPLGARPGCCWPTGPRVMEPVLPGSQLLGTLTSPPASSPWALTRPGLHGARALGPWKVLGRAH